MTCNAVCPGYVMTELIEKQLTNQAKTRGIPKVREQLWVCGCWVGAGVGCCVGGPGGGDDSEKQRTHQAIMRSFPRSVKGNKHSIAVVCVGERVEGSGN